MYPIQWVALLVLTLDRFNLVTLLFTITLKPISLEPNDLTRAAVVGVLFVCISLIASWAWPKALKYAHAINVLRTCLTGTAIGLFLYGANTRLQINEMGLVFVAIFRPPQSILICTLPYNQRDAVAIRTARIKVMARMIGTSLAVLSSVLVRQRQQENAATYLCSATGMLFLCATAMTIFITCERSCLCRHYDAANHRIVDMNFERHEKTLAQLEASTHSVLMIHYLRVLYMKGFVLLLTENVLLATAFRYFFVFDPWSFAMALLTMTGTITLMIMFVPIRVGSPLNRSMFMASSALLVLYSCFLGFFQTYVDHIVIHLVLLALPLLAVSLVSELPYLQSNAVLRGENDSAVSSVQYHSLAQLFAEVMSVVLYVYWFVWYLYAVLAAVLIISVVTWIATESRYRAMLAQIEYAVVDAAIPAPPEPSDSWSTVAMPYTASKDPLVTPAAIPFPVLASV